jgi:hypothetical protein
MRVEISLHGSSGVTLGLPCKAIPHALCPPWQDVFAPTFAHIARGIAQPINLLLQFLKAGFTYF